MKKIDDYLGDKNKRHYKTKDSKDETYKHITEENKKLIKQDVNFEGFDGRINDLIDGIRSFPNYQLTKGIVRQEILPKNPGIDAKKLSIKIGKPEGVALVILYDLYTDKLEEELKQLEESEGSSNQYHLND